MMGYTGLKNPSFVRQWIPVVYIFWNIFFNVVALVGLRVAGARLWLWEQAVLSGQNELVVICLCPHPVL